MLWVPNSMFSDIYESIKIIFDWKEVFLWDLTGEQQKIYFEDQSFDEEFARKLILQENKTKKEILETLES